jgi:hypothetical protein
MAYRIEADIRYIDGTLKDLDLPSGYSVNAPNRASAYRILGWVLRTRAAADFVRAVGTGNRYQFVSDPRLVEFR